MRRASGSEIRRLVASARDGDLAAFTELFDRHRHLLRLLFRSQMSPALRQKADSEDLLQETFLAASRSLPEFRGHDVNAFTRWLEVIAARRVCDAYRRYLGAQKRAARREISLDQMLHQTNRSTERLAAQFAAPTMNPSHGPRRAETLLELARALAELPEHYQEVIKLRFIEERSLDEIATKFTRSKGAVTMLLARAVEQLRLKMTESEG